MSIVPPCYQPEQVCKPLLPGMRETGHTGSLPSIINAFKAEIAQNVYFGNEDLSLIFID
jgi:hypothetical protein